MQRSPRHCARPPPALGYDLGQPLLLKQGWVLLLLVINLDRHHLRATVPSTLARTFHAFCSRVLVL